MKFKAALLIMILVSFICPSVLFCASVQIKEDMPYDIIAVVENSRDMKALDKEAIASFVKELKDNKHLGIVSFEKEAKIIFPLQAVSGDSRKKDAEEALNQIAFKARFRDINKGMDLALSQFKESGRKNASKIVLLFSTGRIYPFGSRKSDVFIKQLRENILPDYRDENVVVYGFVFGKGDLQLIQEITNKTGGKCFFAYDNQTLRDILSLVKEKLQPLVVYDKESVPVKAFIEGTPVLIYPRFISDLTVILGLLFVVILATFSLIFLSNIRIKRIFGAPARSKDKNIQPDAYSFAKLRNSSAQMSKVLTDTEAIFKNLQLDIEDYGAQSWKKEKEAKTKHFNLLTDLFLVIDYLEDSVKKVKNTGELEWFHKKMLRILEDSGIEETPVKIGESFNGVYHKYVGESCASIPKGCISELSRKGYLIRGKTNAEDIVLRPAEVIVSTGGKS